MLDIMKGLETLEEQLRKNAVTLKPMKLEIGSVKSRQNYKLSLNSHSWRIFSFASGAKGDLIERVTYFYFCSKGRLIR